MNRTETKDGISPVLSTAGLAVPVAFIDEHGGIVIVGFDAWNKASFVDSDRAFPESWTGLAPVTANAPDCWSSCGQCENNNSEFKQEAYERLEAIFYQDRNGTRWVYSEYAGSSRNGPDSDDREIGRAVLYLGYNP